MRRRLRPPVRCSGEKIVRRNQTRISTNHVWYGFCAIIFEVITLGHSCFTKRAVRKHKIIFKIEKVGYRSCIVIEVFPICRLVEKRKLPRYFSVLKHPCRLKDAWRVNYRSIRPNSNLKASFFIIRDCSDIRNY